MYFSFDFKDLANPKKRLLLGMLLIVLGVFCMIAKSWYIDVAREDCTSVEAIFDDCKYRSDNHGIEVNSIYLTFDDACKNIENNYSIIRYVAYGFLAVGVLFVISFIVSMCFLTKKESID